MISNVTLLFPGQGSQYVGMGKNFDEFEKLIKKADQILGYSLSEICYNGPSEKIKLTQNAQPAILAHSIALLNKVVPILENKNININCVLGHSLGEYSALVASGALTFEDAVKVVYFRGKFMQEASPNGLGTMFALLNVSQEIVIQGCKYASMDKKTVVPANFNSPSQIVISGHKDACLRAIDWIGENSQKKFRAIELSVSAPFHSPFMESAALKLKKIFKEVTFKENNVPYIANIDAQLYQSGTSPDIIIENLIAQVTGSILWTQSVLKLSNDTICLEIGPGNVLSGLVKKINPKIQVLSLDRNTDWEKLMEI